MSQREFKSGFVAIIGRPNVGKSTFLNNVIGQKIAIMSDKPQTTRNKITGIYTTEEAQLVFLDTPGLHVPKHKLGEYMVGVVHKTLKEVDAILYMVEAGSGYGPGDKHIINTLQEIKTPVFLGINKIDKFPQEVVLEEIAAWKERYNFCDIVPISALEGTKVEALLHSIIEVMPLGPKYYPDDMVTDQPEKQLISELIREKILHFTREEVPHSIAVSVDYLETEAELLKIFASIYTERNSQKGIIIGKGGSMLKKIGQAARKDMERLLGSKIYLDLRVKVKQNWRKKEKFLRDFGYED
ncbi:MAG: GTPase [Clostridia bacterium]|jgi:GTP-binding protein Era|nr:GTPase Era [Clostridiales bacterium]MDK2984972.1 GTPase [Clostridia bacterium]